MQLPRRRLIPMPEFDGLDIQPQPVPEMMLLPDVLPMQQGAPSDALTQLAGLGTQRAMGLLKKKRVATPADALAAWKAGGSL